MVMETRSYSHELRQPNYAVPLARQQRYSLWNKRKQHSGNFIESIKTNVGQESHLSFLLFGINVVQKELTDFSSCPPVLTLNLQQFSFLFQDP